ncbi:ABC-type sugar transport system, periplasmic component [Sanguibacter keddieii DSM 10542]|uniref:ABC-type sugar transport system, periplasmic component n=1 Tax=Sanguibacter keddieii (strain ATCC 51767 / DSM 10542 / NCFB 3025 / ST-74) TaxID=446469 RepID=D1BDP1_SANKS|nr:extracellular solute-binding protein [Sanguibacter keddieii]ACZ21103.1 ABC-type sugar transport system, periplasmic component [Sanguibacter keddieii DSM 10542]
MTDITRRSMLRASLALGGAAVLGGLLGGCAPGRPQPSRTDGAVDLSFWTHDAGYIDFFTAATALASQETDFDYTLDVTQIAATDLVTKIIAQAVAGRGTPDVAGIELGNFARLLRGDIADELMVDLTGTVADVRSDLVEARLAPFSKDGKLYALDSDSPLVVYYYRDDLTSSLGVPTDLETWEEYAEFGAGFYAKTGKSLGAVATGSDLGQVMQIFWMLLLQRGGGLFDADGTLTIQTPEAEEVLTFLVDGVQSGFLTTVADFYGPSMQTALKTEKVLGLWMANWYKTFGLEPNVPEQSGAWRIAPMPRFAGGGGRTSFSGGTGFTAIAGKPNSLAAQEFVRAAYLDPDQQVKRYLDLGYLPTMRSVFERPELLDAQDEYCGGQRLFEVYTDIIDEAPPVYMSPDLFILQTALAGALVDAYRGRLTPREALDSAAESFAAQANK